MVFLFWSVKTSMKSLGVKLHVLNDVACTSDRSVHLMCSTTGYYSLSWTELKIQVLVCMILYILVIKVKQKNKRKHRSFIHSLRMLQRKDCWNELRKVKVLTVKNFWSVLRNVTIARYTENIKGLQRPVFMGWIMPRAFGITKSRVN